MPEINLFGEPGFQENVPRKKKEPLAGSKMKKKPKKKKRPSSMDEIIAALVLIALGSLVVWYLTLRWTVDSEVQELTPEDYHMEGEANTDR